MPDCPGADALGKSLANLADVWTHSNRYHAASACVNCEGIIRHENWCAAVNTNTEYAFLSILEPAVMLEADHIILHGLGVRWNMCERKCAA